VRTFALQTGSCGNCYYYESGDVKLLFDAGISLKCAVKRMAEYGATSDGISGLFISHDHSDHISCAGVFHRGLKTPVHCAQKTFSAMERRMGKIRREIICHFVPGETVEVGHVKVTTLPTPHDAVDPCAFVVDDGQCTVGILTDLGHGFPGLRKILCDLDVVFMESNYDEATLADNMFYPEPLKRRIRGNHGHLENEESANLLRDFADDRLQVVLLCHLSAENNTPELALRTHKRVLANRFPAVDIHVAPRHGVSPLIDSARLKLGRKTQLAFF